MTDQPAEERPEIPDAQAPDPDLRAARRRVQEVGATLRDALAADDELDQDGTR